MFKWPLAVLCCLVFACKPPVVVVPISPTVTTPTTTITLPLPSIPQSDAIERRQKPRDLVTPVFQTHPKSSLAIGNGEDCTVYCALRFGPGVGVTCHAYLTTAGVCRPFCYYQNGYWFDESTGRAIRTPSGTSPEQRPRLDQVAPYGYCSLHNCSGDTWQECPERYENLN